MTFTRAQLDVPKFCSRCWTFFPLYRKQIQERMFTPVQLDVLESYSGSWIFLCCTEAILEVQLNVLESYFRSWIFSLCSKIILGRSLTCLNYVPETKFFPSLQETETRKDDLYPCAAGLAGVVFQKLNILPLFKNHSGTQLDMLESCSRSWFFPLYRKQRQERTTFTRAQLDVLESFSRSWILSLCTIAILGRSWTCLS
jgi:hypothetical protein